MRKPLLALSAVAVSALVLAGCSTGGDAAGDVYYASKGTDGFS